MEEEWKAVSGWEGLYEVSNMGGVRSLGRAVLTCGKLRNFTKRKTIGKKMNPHRDFMGYLRVNLSDSGRRKNVLVHRLVAIAFLENTLGKPHINHIDGKKDNPVASNLEWCTHAENMRHAGAMGAMRRDGVKGEDSIFAKLTAEQVKEIKFLILSGKSRKNIADRYLVSPGAIGEIKAGRTWRHIQIDKECISNQIWLTQPGGPEE